MGIGQQIINGTYGLDNKPLTAYEELKAWCKKHLRKNEWDTEADNGEGYSYIDLYFENKTVIIWFSEDGSYCNFETLSE